MKLELPNDVSIEITGYNKHLAKSLVDALEADNADQASKIFHIMLCDSGMTGNPKPDIKQLYVDEKSKEEAAKAAVVFYDANGKPKKQEVLEHDFPIGLLDDVYKYLGLGKWDDENNLCKNDEFFLSTMHMRYGYDTVEEAIDYVEAL